MSVQGETEAEISIYDAIGGHEINAKQFSDDLKALDVDTIHLRINSPGGSVIDGNAIFNALTRHKAKVITHIDGLAASMASVIAMAGDEIHMADNALFMVHNPWTVTMGSADELRADADLLDKMAASILNAYSRSQYEPAEIKDLMDAETWLTAQEALDAGFIDKIEGGLKAAATIYDMASSFDHTVPTDKLIASMSAKVDAVSRSRDEIKAQLDAQALELVDVRAELEAADIAKAEALEAVEQAQGALEASKVEIEKAKADIEAAKEISAEKISQAAAELMQSSAVAPVADSGDGLDSKTDEQLLAQYESFSDTEERREFFASNKTKILRAKSRQTNQPSN